MQILKAGSSKDEKAFQVIKDDYQINEVLQKNHLSLINSEIICSFLMMTLS